MQAGRSVHNLCVLRCTDPGNVLGGISLRIYFQERTVIVTALGTQQALRGFRPHPGASEASTARSSHVREKTRLSLLVQCERRWGTGGLTAPPAAAMGGCRPADGSLRRCPGWVPACPTTGQLGATIFTSPWGAEWCHSERRD